MLLNKYILLFIFFIKKPIIMCIVPIQIPIQCYIYEG